VRLLPTIRFACAASRPTARERTGGEPRWHESGRARLGRTRRQRHAGFQFAQAVGFCQATPDQVALNPHGLGGAFRVPPPSGGVGLRGFEFDFRSLDLALESASRLQSADIEGDRRRPDVGNHLRSRASAIEISLSTSSVSRRATTCPCVTIWPSTTSRLASRPRLAGEIRCSFT